MTGPEIIGAAVGIGGLVLAVAVQGGTFAFMIGKHAQRLNTNERDVQELKRKTDDHAAVISGIEGMKGLLAEVRDDVKNLLTGKVTPARRKPAED